MASEPPYRPHLHHRPARGALASGAARGERAGRGEGLCAPQATPARCLAHVPRSARRLGAARKRARRATLKTRRRGGSCCARSRPILVTIRGVSSWRIAVARHFCSRRTREGSRSGKPVPTPDALDLLITARNHDVKAAIAQDASVRGLGLRARQPPDIRGLWREGQLRHRAHERRLVEPTDAGPRSRRAGRGSRSVVLVATRPWGAAPMPEHRDHADPRWSGASVVPAMARRPAARRAGTRPLVHRGLPSRPADRAGQPPRRRARRVKGRASGSQGVCRCAR